MGQYQDLSNPDPVGRPGVQRGLPRRVCQRCCRTGSATRPNSWSYMLGKPLPPAHRPGAGDSARFLGRQRQVPLCWATTRTPASPGPFEIKFSVTQYGSALRLQILDKAGHVLRTLVRELCGQRQPHVPVPSGTVVCAAGGVPIPVDGQRAGVPAGNQNLSA
jgi:hypothetical protein